MELWGAPLATSTATAPGWDIPHHNTTQVHVTPGIYTHNLIHMLQTNRSYWMGHHSVARPVLVLVHKSRAPKRTHQRGKNKSNSFFTRRGAELGGSRGVHDSLTGWDSKPNSM